MSRIPTRLKRFIKECLPPLVARVIQPSSKLGFVGNYPDWQSAKNDCFGYDQPSILEVVTKATLEVVEGRAAFERDSVIFDKPDFNWPLLAILQNILRKEDNTLHLLDFGGSLGSTYRQCKPFLEGASKIEWLVIEQPTFVERGRQMFAHGDLQFHFEIEEALSNSRPKTVLLSSVLQYVENPFTLLRKIIDLDFKYIVIDRTPISKEGCERIVKQVVPPEIYVASYPARVFEENQILGPLLDHYHLKAEFAALDNFDAKSRFMGFFFERKPSLSPPALSLKREKNL